MPSKINLDRFVLGDEILRRVPYDLMRKYEFIPFDFQNEKLYVAVSESQGPAALDPIRMATGYELEVFPAERASVLARLESLSPEARQPRDRQLEAAAEGLERADGGEAEAVGIAQRILQLAVQKGASDIHLEPQQESLFLRFRMDGILFSIRKFSKGTQPSLTSRFKILAGIDITEKRLPQDGQFSQTVAGRLVDFRVSTLPGKYGEKLVVRVLDKSNFALDLGQLGLEAAQQSVFETLIQKPQGLFLATGPTGSGKTTTLYSALNRLRSPLKNVITLEDPIEYELLADKADASGVTQVQVQSKIGMTFASGLRAALRQDPDILMVGEIRDRETAEIAMRAALTGHLVLSTLHTNDAVSTVLRLRDMGVEPYLIGATLIGVLAQRLVRQLCPDCREPYRPPQRLMETLLPKPGARRDVKLYRARGCERCHFRGYRGRRGIFELLTFTEDIRQRMTADTDREGLEQALRKGRIQTLRESGLACVLEGATTVEEIFRTTVE